jgi:phosphomannomutase
LSERTPIRFGTDGWRAGIAQDFTFAAVSRLAYGLAQYILNDQNRDNRVIVGFDRRFASEDFARTAAGVLSAAGLEVIMSDRAAPTQLFSFGAAQNGCMALVVTASHNPWTDNGIKIKDETGAPAAEAVLRAIEAAVPDLEPERRPAASVPADDVTQDYRARLRELVDIDLIRGMRASIIVDPMHGCGAGWMEALLSGVDGRHLTITEIRGERNPYFGGVNPEPIMANLEALRQSVLSNGADGGIAFDGDADRVGLITESGRFVNQLQVYGLLYLHLLRDRRLRGPAVYTITTTQMIPRLAAAFDTQAYETSVGFKYVGPKMQEVGAIIGGEESGGFGFGFHIPERDGLLAALLLLEMRAQRSASFDTMLDELQETYGPSEYARIDFRFNREEYSEVMATALTDIETKIDEALGSEDVKEVVKLSADGGFKVYFADESWLLLRFSGTEPVLRIYAEAPSLTRVDRLLRAGRAMTSR